MILELQPILAVGSISYATFKYLWKVFAERQRKLKSTPHYSFNVYVKKQKKDEKHLRLKVKVDLPGFDFDFFNIAICGLPNTGKTALVNSLRRLKDGDNGRHSYILYSQVCLDFSIAGSHLSTTRLVQK